MAENIEPEIKRLKKDENKDLGKCLKSNIDLEKESLILMDDDNSLEHVEKILIDIHTNFYKQYDLNKQVRLFNFLIIFLDNRREKNNALSSSRSF